MDFIESTIDPEARVVLEADRIAWPDFVSDHLLQSFRSGLAIDVGAHLGMYARLFSDRFASVIAIEPIPALADWLRRSLPSSCIVHQVAAGWRDGEAVLRIPLIGDGHDHSLATLSSYEVEMSDATGFETLVVDERRLDTLLRSRSASVAFIKIDCEGYEYRVLQGAEGILTCDYPILLIEIERRHNPDFRNVFTYLADLGYYPYELEGYKFCPSTPDVVDEAYLMLRRFNLIIDDKFNQQLRSLGLRYRNNFFFLPC